MAKDDEQFNAANRAYQIAKDEGNREEEARWANVIGNVLKNKGEYVKALTWLRRDYDISVKYLPQKQSFATCQSLGEVYLRLLDFKNALNYQVSSIAFAIDYLFVFVVWLYWIIWILIGFVEMSYDMCFFFLCVFFGCTG